MSPYEVQSVPTTLDKMKMLFWRLDLKKRSFVNLNECVCGVLGLENYRFFKDRKYRERILFPDDLMTIDWAFTSFKERIAVRTVFRVQSGGSIHWFKLTGWPTNDHRYYEGAVEDISEHISRLKAVFDQQNSDLLDISAAMHPVAIFTEHENKLLDANPAFIKLFSLNSLPNDRLYLSELVKSEIKLPLLMETLLLEGRLDTDLLLSVDHCDSCKISCVFKYFTQEGRGYIRFAVVDRPVASDLTGVDVPHQPAQRHEVGLLCQKISECLSVDQMLDVIYESRELFPGMDVVMFSDIYARQNKVIVYSKGEMLEPLKSGSQYPYTGTIAENIDKENLEYLIVDDTQSSIKAIDWVLFVPKGILSYVAKALYVRGAMRTVLIFCSLSVGTFNEEHIADVSAISTAFHQQLKKIRRNSKK